MSIPLINPRHVFGISTNFKSNVAFVDETNVAYTAGNQLVTYNSELKLQKFQQIHVNDDDACSCMAMHFGIAAIAIKPNADSNRTACAFLYDVAGSRRRRILALGDLAVKSIVSLLNSGIYFSCVLVRRQASICPSGGSRLDNPRLSC